MNKHRLVVAIAIFGLTGIAHAASGAYVQAQGGIGGMDTKRYSANSTPTLASPYTSVSRHSGVAYRVSAGYLWGESDFNYGVELGYASYPKNKYQLGSGLGFATSTETYTGSNIDLLGVAKYNLNNLVQGFYVVGKAGIARVHQEFHGEFTSGGVSSVYTNTTNKLRPEAAVGVGYDFNSNLSMEVSYHHIFAGQPDPNGSTANSVARAASVNTLMAGLAYHFS